MAIAFNSIVTYKLPLNKTRLKNWVASTIKKEKLKEGKLAFTFCSDADLLKINKEFLNHDTLTDIVTFDYSERETISGEIYISADRVKENADNFGVNFEVELRRVIIHGVLHLCGYGDKTGTEKKLMRQKEDAALRSFSRMK